MKTLEWKTLNESSRKKALERLRFTEDTGVKSRVSEILADIRARGDEALLETERTFDCPTLTRLEVTAEEWSDCDDISVELKNAISRAYRNIERFHAAGLPKAYEVETQAGIRCQRLPRAIERVGLYIPGGTAPLISTVLMLGVPSRLAGNPVRLLCTPPNREGNIHPAILFAARLCGIERVFKLGGAAAVGALAFGTESVPSVSKIFGPGNAYVTEAKQQVSLFGTAIDMPAGPSEVMVVGDDSANATAVAADLLSQAEHGPDSDIIFLTDNSKLLENVKQELEKQTECLPRKEIARASLSNARLILTGSVDEAIEIANAYAPEHLILQVKEAEKTVDAIQNAGSVFVGAWTPESVGDYASGTNHVLPTYGYARAYSGLSVSDFMRTMSVQRLTKEALEDLGPHVVTLARAESLEAHARAVEVRLGGKS